MNNLDTLFDLPPAVFWLVIALAVLSVTLTVTGLIAVARTSETELPLSFPRIAWFLLCFIQFIGPISFLVLRRRERQLTQDHAVTTTDSLTASDDHQGLGTSGDDVVSYLYD